MAFPVEIDISAASAALEFVPLSWSPISAFAVKMELDAAAREAQPTFARDYQQRAGIEGTISAGVRVLRRSRYRSCQNALATRADGGCHDPHPTRGLVRWHAAPTNAAIRIHQADDGSYPIMINSPAVSFSRQVHGLFATMACIAR
jgi:hypothetical protein